MIQPETINSTCVTTLAYDDEAHTLYIRFKSRAIYRYNAVEPRHFQEFMHAESKGAFFVARIKGRFPTKKMQKKARGK